MLHLLTECMHLVVKCNIIVLADADGETHHQYELQQPGQHWVHAVTKMQLFLEATAFTLVLCLVPCALLVVYMMYYALLAGTYIFTGCTCIVWLARPPQ